MACVGCIRRLSILNLVFFYSIILPCLTLPCLILPCPALPCPMSPRLFLASSVLSRPVLSCLVLSYHLILVLFDRHLINEGIKSLLALPLPTRSPFEAPSGSKNKSTGSSKNRLNKDGSDDEKNEEGDWVRSPSSLFLSGRLQETLSKSEI